ncbi:unnamed protein product [Mytilus coruscus]|uniref:Uncharacterized protein n=1 Tax=Mytilus coruscus TaxID=42192 RepID=A0A6J8D7A7_MYTCO|nr:unnamed protein product [Mytilus coruscus]
MEDLMTDIHFLMFKESDMPPKSTYFKCVLCSKCTKPKERATVNKDITKYLRRKFVIEAKDGDIICNKCRHIFRKERDHKVLPCVKTSKSSSQTTATFSPPSVTLKIPSTSKSHAYCCICKKPGPKLIVISPDVRTATYVDNNILIPSGNRCCSNHICDGHLNDDALCRIKTTDESFVNRTYLLEIMNEMRKKIRESASRRLNFDDSNLSEPDYITMTGLSKINFSERRPYSTHKGRPLVKPMIVCTTTGYYVSVLGPYLADYRNNDASILTHMLKTNVEEIRDWIRWIVESSNARIKTWKYLSHTLPTNQIPFIGDFVRIVRALSNKYAPPLSQCRDVESDQLEAAKMIHLSKMSNTLKEHVETENLLKKKLIWKVASECDFENFPRLDDQELRNITCGVYQMKLASSYIQEYNDEESDIYLFTGKTQTYSGLKCKAGILLQRSINSGLDIMNHILTHGIAFAELELELLEHVLMLLLCCGILVKNCTKTNQCHMELGTGENMF